MAEPVILSDANFSQTLADNNYVLVDFWAEWCGPCRMIAPTIKELANDYQGQVTVAKLDVDANPQTAMKYRVMSIPTIILFKNGQPVEVMVGAQPKPSFVAKIGKHLPTVAN
jgi:thioredoxin 1